MATHEQDSQSEEQLQGTTSQQQAQLPPATPVYVLRGHGAPIHALCFFGQNSKLASGDADGWIVIWSVVTKRPIAVWKAHEGAVLEVKGFFFEQPTGEVQIFTHGRDHKLRLWSFKAQDEEILDKTLPVDLNKKPAMGAKAQPWLHHSLSVNALNFCAFSLCFIPISPEQGDTDGSGNQAALTTSKSPLLLAVPNALDSGGIDIFHLPSERRVCTIPSDRKTQTGMLMAVNLFISPASGDLYIASGYEDGHVMVHARRGPLRLEDAEDSSVWKWEKLYENRPHTQPVLSLDVPPTKEYFLTSSADAVLAKHPIPELTPHPHISSSALEENPIKTVNTKHAGQQGLRVRSDGKIFATAGWDCRVRVYACKNMKEMAVLKWHKEGCYAVAFAEVFDADRPSEPQRAPTEGNTGISPRQAEDNDDKGDDDRSLVQTRPIGSLAAIHQQRNQKAQRTHWLAAGAKDGKISLWDIY
ncbi:WD repeat protein [Thermoascus aurantiacus ATCC 26904]